MKSTGEQDEAHQSKHRSRSSWTPSLKKVLRSHPSSGSTATTSSSSPSSPSAASSSPSSNSLRRQVARSSPPCDLMSSHAAGPVLEKLPEDDCFSPPIGMTPPSPGTPQKVWERQYKSFLSRKKLPSSGRDELDISSNVIDAQTARRFPLNAVKNPATGADHSEESVRGGQFFASVFSGKSHRRASKSRSQDELDGTLRRGSERRHHPSLLTGSDAYASMSSSLPNFLLKEHNTSRRVGGGNSLLLPRGRSLLAEQLRLGHSITEPDLNEALANHTVEPAPARSVSNNVPASAMKRMFTEFHNSTQAGRDTASAFLGDDPSLREGADIALCRLRISSAPTNAALLSRPPAAVSRPIFASNVTTNDVVTAGSYIQSVEASGSYVLGPRRMLKPLISVDHWQSGRRYLIAPAVWTACPMGIMATLSRKCDVRSASEACSMQHSPFGTILLGPCLLMSQTDSEVNSMGTSYENQWSRAVLVLRQNYLLEYGLDDPLVGLPRGYAHLEYATCCIHPAHKNTLELDFYGSPCAKSDRRCILIRPDELSDCQDWLECLSTASTMGISDLYYYNEKEALGTGSYASVFAAKRKCASAPDGCAVKIFCKTMFWRCVIKGRERADTIVREVSVQATLTAKCSDVQSFLRIRGFFETTNHVVIESELLEATDLFRYISSRPRSTESEAATIIYNILLCLQAMNRNGLSHRDIKPANILICDKTQPLTVKVADFGLATFMDVDGKISGRCGTPGFVAPEIFHAGIHGVYNNKIDIFSAGVTLYVMLCGYEPFYGESDAELIRANKHAVVEFPEEDWKLISASARDLVEKMMHADPHQRLSAEQSICHPWIRQHIDQSAMQAKSHAAEMPVYDACSVS